MGFQKRPGMPPRKVRPRKSTTRSGGDQTSICASSLVKTLFSFPDIPNAWQCLQSVCQRMLTSERAKRAEKASCENGCPKRYFWRVRFFSAPSSFALEAPENLRGTEKKRTLQQHPFGQPFLCTAPSPLLWRTTITVRPLLLGWKDAVPSLPCRRSLQRAPCSSAYRLSQLVLFRPNERAWIKNLSAGPKRGSLPSVAK